MPIALAALLIITIMASFWARRLAVSRGRRVTAWVLATAWFPPAVLILLALPPRTAPEPPAGACS